MPGFLTNDLPILGQVSSNMRVPVDTEFVRGVNPASVAAFALQIAATLMECTANTSTAAMGAAQGANTFGGVATITGVTTAPGATLTLPLTNTLITAAYVATGKVPQASIVSGAAQVGGGIPPDVMSAMMVLQSATPAVGGCTFVWQNQGATAIAGPMLVVWHL